MSASVRTPAIAAPAELVFGVAPKPVTCGFGLTIGGGEVYPEINFTLPTMDITPDTWADVGRIYDEIMETLLARARRLQVPGLVVELEQLPPLTANPQWGAEITERIKTQLQAAHDAWGLKSALRVTIIDLREETRPPQRRSGPSWDAMWQSLQLCSQRGADILSIESTGGKEVHDRALTTADLPGIMLALGVLAPADMAWLWDRFGEVAAAHPGVISGGDTACGFANTAMQLAEQNMLPETLAAIDRVLTCVRSLIAFEHGAVGPSKDCGYEGPVMKAAAGVPISMEGRSATCAHLSPIGNIAAMAADLWSNESVNAVQLLSGTAPLASLESLAYDCRMMNTATRRGDALALRDMHVESDAGLSPQAWVLTPQNAVRITEAILRDDDPYRRTLAALQVACDMLAEGAAARAFVMTRREQRWFDKLRAAAVKLPNDAEALMAQTQPTYGERYAPAEYGF